MTLHMCVSHSILYITPNLKISQNDAKDSIVLKGVNLEDLLIVSHIVGVLVDSCALQGFLKRV